MASLKDTAVGRQLPSRKREKSIRDLASVQTSVRPSGPQSAFISAREIIEIIISSGFF
jgi:hypothetical protein